jgi:phosphoenolpyruvate carboxykinase (ATP)
MDEHTFLLNRERAIDYLNSLDRLYIFDGFAGWDPEVSGFRLHPVPCATV